MKQVCSRRRERKNDEDEKGQQLEKVEGGGASRLPVLTNVNTLRVQGGGVGGGGGQGRRDVLTLLQSTC